MKLAVLAFLRIDAAYPLGLLHGLLIGYESVDD